MDYEKVRDLSFDELSGTISEEEKSWLRNAIREDLQARNIWEDIQRDSSRLLTDASDSFDQHPAEEVLGGLQQRRRRSYLLKVSSIAAACLLAMLGSWYLFSTKAPQPLAANDSTAHTIRLVTAEGKVIDLSNDSTGIRVDNAVLNNKQHTLSFDVSHQNGSGINTLTVPAGKDYHLLLADGTKVQLNAATTISFPFSFTGKTREVTVSGEAFFQVAAKAGQPFIVHLPGSTVNVLGTAFNINTYDSGVVKVALVEGSVKVASNRHDIVLKPGYEITTTKNGVSKESFDPDLVLGWRTGLYTFEDASLQELAPIIHRWFGVTIALDNARVASRRFFGVIDWNRPLEDFQHNLERADGIRSHYDQQGILHFE
ncbi:FecR family protein [Chitinophaga qingshengii]|uniref:FecR domain-containing protein n=1 Tax=Chitinophaga qingshengii TaxID=1569794 RepID=A0ABR7TP24_9BACT|nr:FecR domain-containing protein [Chitinophaga qingshengii]MBC9932226.1 FecR domain-containing protein [Chitinophaga qingshengii]